MTGQNPAWLNDKGIVNEVRFCQEFVEKMPLICVKGKFYGLDGQISDDIISRDISIKLTEFETSNISRIVKNLLEALKLHCHSAPPEMNPYQIHLLNGIVNIDGQFSPEKQFCVNRLHVNYDPALTDLPKPERFLQFINELLYFANKLAQAFTTAGGSDAGEIITNGLKNIAQVFHNPLPSFAPIDLLVGVAGALLIKLFIYVKGKNAKKYRKGCEYGYARWGTAADIKPYMAQKFEDNVILTETERLTMEGRPAAGPKYARNKNILVVGGSGSGKTRFFVKPNLLQMHSSYVLTDPKMLVYKGHKILCQKGVA